MGRSPAVRRKGFVSREGIRVNFESASCEFRSTFGQGRLHVYSFGPHEEDNILCIEANGPRRDAPTLVRVQSSCYTAEIFRSLDCDCHGQLSASLRRIFAEGGLLAYMLSDGRGAGLLTKIRGMRLGDDAGLDTFDAYKRLGVEDVDIRSYERASTVLTDLGAGVIELLTNNFRKTEGLRRSGISVSTTSLRIDPTADSRPYLLTKQEKMGHDLGIGNYL